MAYTIPCDAMPAPTPRILIIGDSISAAYGIPQNKGWVALLRDKLIVTHPKYEVVNASISGDTSASGLNRLPQLLKRYSPQIVIIELGGNDGLRGLGLQTTQNNLEKMIKMSKQHSAKVLLLGIRLPTNYGTEYNKKFQGMFQNLAQKHAVSLVPKLLNHVGGHASLMQNDGIHPKAIAQPQLLNNVWPKLRPLL